MKLSENASRVRGAFSVSLRDTRHPLTSFATANDPLRFKSDVAELMKKRDFSRPKPVLDLAAG